MDRNIDRLNRNSVDDTKALFMRICGSPKWGSIMEQRRPFCCVNGLVAIAIEVWRALPDHAAMAAIMHHPRIGDKVVNEKEYDETERIFIAQEARAPGGKKMSTEIRRQLVQGNREYENKFGFIYVVSAFGKSDEEMLSLLQQRLRSSPHKEFQVARDEEEKVLQRRLTEMFGTARLGPPRSRL